MLDRDLELHTARVRLGPDKAGVDDAHFGKTAQFAKTEGEQFARLGLGDDPLLRR